MNPFQQAAETFKREAIRLDGLRAAAAEFERIGSLEAYAGELQGRVDALTAALGVDGLQAQADGLKGRASELQATVAALGAEQSTLSASVACLKSEEAGWLLKNADHAEAAKSWNGEAERVLADARKQAADIIAAAKESAPDIAAAEVRRIKAEASRAAKENADAYEAKRRSALADVEARIEAATAEHEGLTAQCATARGELDKTVEHIESNLASLKKKRS